jgi:hypothetical protein
MGNPHLAAPETVSVIFVRPPRQQSEPQRGFITKRTAAITSSPNTTLGMTVDIYLCIELEDLVYLHEQLITTTL